MKGNQTSVTLELSGMKLKTYSGSRIELRSLQIVKKNAGKSSQLLSSGHEAFEPKSMDVALNIAGIDKNFNN